MSCPRTAAEWWTAEDSRAAVEQGWDLFETLHSGERHAFMEIQKDDDRNVFRSDAEAVRFVTALASSNKTAAKGLHLDGIRAGHVIFLPLALEAMLA